MEKQKAYVSGKITGLTEEEYLRLFSEAKKKAKEKGYVAISPTELPHDHNKTWESYMREDLIEMLKCDVVFAMANWHESKGATIEVNLAKSIGMKVIFETNQIQTS